MSANAITVSYLAAAVLFIVAIKGFAKPETAKGGNRLGILGMAIAVAVTMALAFREGTAGLPIVVILSPPISGSYHPHNQKEHDGYIVCTPQKNHTRKKKLSR